MCKQLQQQRRGGIRWETIQNSRSSSLLFLLFQFLCFMWRNIALIVCNIIRVPGGWFYRIVQRFPSFYNIIITSLIKCECEAIRIDQGLDFSHSIHLPFFPLFKFSLFFTFRNCLMKNSFYIKKKNLVHMIVNAIKCRNF